MTRGGRRAASASRCCDRQCLATAVLCYQKTKLPSRQIAFATRHLGRQHAGFGFCVSDSCVPLCDMVEFLADGVPETDEVSGDDCGGPPTAKRAKAPNWHPKLLKLFNQILNAVTEVNAVNEHGKTALHVACSRGLERAVKALLEAGADINRLTSDDASSLYLACYGGHEDVVQVLLENNAKLNPVSRGSVFEPLIVAASRGNSLSVV